MAEDRLSRVGPLSGVLFTALELGGFAVGAAAGRAMVTLADPSAKVLRAFARPAGAGVCVGAYMEFASLAALAVFAAWLFRSRAGAIDTAGLLAASMCIAVTAVSLVVGDVLEYQAGHAISVQPTLALYDLQAGLYTATWGIAAAFLTLAPVTGWLRRSALAIAGLSLIGMAIPKAAPGQLAALLFIAWVLAASVSAARRPRAALRAAAAHA